MKQQRRPFLASMGIYVFKYDHLETLLATKTTSWVDFGKEIIPAAIQVRDEMCRRSCLTDYWEDIGTIGAFYTANLDLTTKIPKFNLFDAEAPRLHTRTLPAAFQDRRDARSATAILGRRLHHQWRQDH